MLEVLTNVSEEPTASIFRVKDGGSGFFCLEDGRGRFL
jgi:hypothetical protein